MQIKDDDTPSLKDWLTKKLEQISDAESDILADYVLALVKNDDPEEEVRSTSIESLEEFLHNNTSKFVDEVILAIKQRSYVPGYVAPRPKPSQVENTARLTAQLTGAPSAPHGLNGHQPAQQQKSRKRSHNEFQGRDDEAGRHQSRGSNRSKRGRGRGGTYRDPDAPVEHAVRGRPHSQPQREQVCYPTPPVAAGGFHPSQFPQFPAGVLPDFDPNNPMASMAAFQQALGLPPLPNMSPSAGGYMPTGGFPPPVKTHGAQQGFGTRSQQCREFEEHGSCAAGDNCPYQHIKVPTSPIYDPENPSLPPQPSFPQPNFNNILVQNSPFLDPTNSKPTSKRYNNRASRGHPRPSHDPNNKTVIIERIPPTSLNEEAVRSYFTPFGPIESLSVDTADSTATIKYATKAAAINAYKSPDAIFGNRFVKIFWNNPNRAKQNHGNNSTQHANLPHTRRDLSGSTRIDHEMPDVGVDADTEEPAPTAEEIAARAETAQRQHEEKANKIAAAAAAKEDLDKRIREQAEERKKLLAKLSQKLVAPPSGISEKGEEGKIRNDDISGEGNDSNGNTRTNGTTSSRPPPNSTQTDILRLKLATLEAEAETLGLHPHPTDDISSPNGTNSTNGPSPYWASSSAFDASSGTSPAHVYLRGGYTPRNGSFPRAGRRGGFGGGVGRGAGPWHAGGASGAAAGAGAGAVSGRGGHAAGMGMGRGAVARLDNRPKAVSVTLSNNSGNNSDTSAKFTSKATNVDPTQPKPQNGPTDDEEHESTAVTTDAALPSTFHNPDATTALTNFLTSTTADASCWSLDPDPESNPPSSNSPPSDFTTQTTNPMITKITTVVHFTARYLAEIFIQRAKAAGAAKAFGGGAWIPGLGYVELGWFRGEAVGAMGGSGVASGGKQSKGEGGAMDVGEKGADVDDGTKLTSTAVVMDQNSASAKTDVDVENSHTAAAHPPSVPADGMQEMDYDIATAEDDDRWT